MSEEIKFERVMPTSTTSRYPEWEVKHTGYGFERRTLMSELGFNEWQKKLMQGVS